MSTVFSKIRDLVSSFLRSSESYEEAVGIFVKELQKEMIRADVNVRVVSELTSRIKERALKEEPPPGVLRKEWFIKIVYDELSKLLGGDTSPEPFPKSFPWIVLLVGIQGSGKTTTAGKLALFYKKRGYRVGLATTDVYRPAAYDQLKQIADSIGVPFYGERSGDPIEIAKKSIKTLLNEYFCDVVIVDTAGRHGYGKEEDLLKEMKYIAESIKPSEVVLVVDASIGQKAFDLAKKFHEWTPIGSIVITKLDGTARGGGALSAVTATGAKIKFIGDGEKLEDFEVFNSRKFVARILGLGDIESLLEKFRAIEESDEIRRRLEKAVAIGRMSMRDIYHQLKSIKKLGPLRKILDLVPGFSMLKIGDEVLRGGEKKMDVWVSIIDSMTYRELDNPELVDKSRARRIAVGSGRSISEVRELLNYYELVNKMLRDLKRGKIRLKGLDLSKLGGGSGE
ncbi:MAG: signal recognition particle protein Srp54 [Sulfolobales archaeon]|nr:signal recognition particle protein Srp54 [Sulfolobales archaeon]MCX8208356.1 signal recognition particle protein Srp54 [Sulfolobales archaeon]MDW8010098.1 signal recognition particle protein Srp54 [Sulfolobales archaeon]